MPKRVLSHSFFLEALAVVVTLLSSVYTLRGMLVYGATTMTHDNLYWDFPIVSFLAESLMSGRLPLWNPFDNGGMPFFPSIVAARHLEPLSIATILIGKLFTRDLVLIFHWIRFVLSVVTLLGAYAVMRLFTPHLAARVACLPVLFFSYFMIGSFRQPCLIQLLAWLPWIVYLCLRIVHFGDGKLRNWALLGLLVGINFQSYYFASTWLMLLFLLVGLAMFRGSALLAAWDSPVNRRGAIVAAVIAAAMMAPNAAVWIEGKDLVFPVRMLPQDYRSAAPTHSPMQYEGRPENLVEGMRLPYEAIEHSGTIATLWSLFQIVAPDAAFQVGDSMIQPWRAGHDGHGYLGWLFVVIALVGVLFGADPLKRVWLVLLGGFTLTLLGPHGIVHPLMYPWFAPLWFLRHTFFLVLVAWFIGLYFFVLGINRLLSEDRLRLTAMDLAIGAPVAAALAYAIKAMVSAEMSAPGNTPLWIAALGAMIYLLRKHRGALLIGLAFGHALGVCLLTPNRLSAAFHLTWTVGIPLLALRGLTKTRWAAAVVLIATLCADFGIHFSSHGEFYDWYPSPHRWPQTSVTPVAPTVPLARESFPFSPKVHPAEQGIRLLGVVHRRPYALSALLREADVDFATALGQPRWNTFYLPKAYFALLHSGLPVKTLAESFRLGVSPLSVAEGDASYRVLEYDYNSLSVEIEARTAGALYWADGYDKHWEATLDDKPLPVRPSRVAFKEVSFPAGRHRIDFSYRPRLFLMACLVYYSTLCLVAILALAGYAYRCLYLEYLAENLRRTGKQLLHRLSYRRQAT